MQYVSARCFRVFFLLAALSALPVFQTFGQQTYVGRFDVYGGYAYLNSPHINLAENGFQFQAGVRVVSWLTMGFDYSRTTGDTTITPSMLTTELQQQLGGTLLQLIQNGVVPPTYTLAVPISSVTQTFAGGPQLSYHGWSHGTFFIRPALGDIHEAATAHPNPADPIAVLLVGGLVPSGIKKDDVLFYGFGGGVDLNLTKHFAIRIQADFVHDHLFSDMLKDSRNTVRIGIGPAIQFGGNVMK